MAAPLVSVIIPTYNSEKFIVQSIHSVLAQTHQRYEIIVVDDGSTDETKDVLHEFGGRIQYVYQQNRGPSAARNTGIKIAQGEYLCFLDADDVWTPHKLEVQLAFMEQHHDIGLVFSDESGINEDGILNKSLVAKSMFHAELVSQVPIREAVRKLLIENFIPTSTVMARKNCVARVGLFDESLRVAEDRDMWSRIAADCSIGYLPLIVGQKRAHQHNISNNSELTLRSRIKIWENARHRFSNCTPSLFLNNLLADAHLQLGYILLAKNQRKEARQAGLRSLAYAVRHVAMRGTQDKSLPTYRWFHGVSLILFTFMGWPITQSLWRAKNAIFKRNTKNYADFSVG
jgi:glycosyltransferase involved in cell wall biosynthesis